MSLSRRTLTARWVRFGLLLVPLLLALLHASGVWPIGFVTQLDLAIDDARLRLSVPNTLDPRVVIVDIDEPAMQEIGRWPWGRDRMAALTDELFVRQGAAVVGFDLVFAEADSSSGLPALERLAATDPVLANRLPAWRSALDNDERFARALAGRAAVLGFHFTSDRGAHRSGSLPAPVFDARVLGGRPIRFTEWNGYAANLPRLAQAAPSAGFFNSLPDADGVVRAMPLIAAHAGRHYETLALAMFRRHTGQPQVEPGFPPEGWLPSGYSGLESIQLLQGPNRLAVPVDERVAVRVPYRGAGGPRGGSFRYVSAADLLQGRLAAGQLSGALVLVGSSAPGLFDIRSTPLGRAYPGVEVHANLLSGLLDGHLPVQPDWARGYEVALLVLTALAMAVLLTRLRAVPQVLAMLALTAALVGFNLWLYAARALVLPLASALLMLALVYVGAMSWGYLRESRTRRLLTRLFGTYVSPERVREMARDPERYTMQAENRELSVMFCDMRNFTQVSESLSPQALRELVNRFFSAMTTVIGAHRGTLDKYIGDALMAFWGAPLDDPLHAERAVRAAQEMVRQLAPLNADLRSAGLPPMGVGIGVNSGLVCVGDMGSDARRSYTVMGDAVNLASRIEALTRHYGVDILVGEATRRAAADAFRWVEVDRVRVKGKQQCVTLFTPLNDAAPSGDSSDEEVRLWALALAACRLQHWDDAESHLHDLHDLCARHAPHGASGLSTLHRQLAQRIQHHRLHPPPPDWDGSHTFDTK